MQNYKNNENNEIITKTSIGIIIIRINKTQPEVLLVHKRCTYSFNEFIYGHYGSTDINCNNNNNDNNCNFNNFNNGKNNKNYTKIESILEQMTTEELLDVWSLNFDQMWYRYCLFNKSNYTKKNDHIYNKKYAKFQSTFMRDDGIRLRKLIENITNRGNLLWEVPKGRKLNAKESDINCAMREIEEETGVKKGQYNFIPNAKRKVSFISCGVKYVCIYYIALANESLFHINLEYKLLKNLKSLNRVQEIFEIKWFDIHQLRLFDSMNNKKWLESLIAPAFRLVLNIKKR